MDNNGESGRLIVSYLTLRKALGVLGVALPVLLVVVCLVFGACAGIKESISDYYDSVSRDILVGILFVMGLVLFSYKGYESRDDRVGDFACVCAIGTALFPSTDPHFWVTALHFIFAASLFGAFAYFSLVIFRKTDPNKPRTAEKKVRDKVYLICGLIVVACIVLIGVHKLFLTGSGLGALMPVFWLETFALWAFGFSWITKGEMLWKDVAVHP